MTRQLISRNLILGFSNYHLFHSERIRSLRPIKRMTGRFGWWGGQTMSTIIIVIIIVIVITMAQAIRQCECVGSDSRSFSFVLSINSLCAHVDACKV